jgi:hypothetical protein
MGSGIGIKKMPKSKSCPSSIKGNLEISKSRAGVLICGDPQGLRSLAKLLVWLADVDQEALPTMPDGEREHVPLYCSLPYQQLNSFSVSTELCRLDAKGTGEFPKKYRQNVGRKK